MNALVIGGTGGIGQAVVRRFVEQGSSVVFTYLKSEESATSLVAELTKQGGDVRACQLDLRSDTVTKPTPGMLAAMAAAEVGDEQEREDPTTNELQRRAAELLGTELEQAMAGKALRRLGARDERFDAPVAHGDGVVLEQRAGVMRAVALAPGRVHRLELEQRPRQRNGILCAHAMHDNRIPRKRPQRAKRP